MKENLKKKIFNEYVYIVLAVIFTYCVTLRTRLDLSTVVLMPIFLLIAFIINPIRILISYNSEFKKILLKTKRALYYVITIFPIVFAIFIISFALISDYLYGMWNNKL